MRVLRQVDLSAWHTFSAHAQADRLLVMEAADELRDIRAQDHILGGGSNTVFVGEVRRRLVHPAWKGMKIIDETPEAVKLRVAAGENWDDLVSCASRRGWYGLENLAAIPGKVGAAPVQNIGAYGRECDKVIDTIEVYDRFDKCFCDIPASACDFSYRDSRFKREWRARHVIVAVIFSLKKHADLHLDYGLLAQYRERLKTPLDVCRAVTKIRWSKLPHPEILPNAGSFFHNPLVRRDVLKALRKGYPELPFHPGAKTMVKIPAAWLIERCGFKGARDGPVGVYDKHALILVNQGGSGEQILAFARKIRDDVEARFGIRLVREPIVIGEYDGD